MLSIESTWSDGRLGELLQFAGFAKARKVAKGSLLFGLLHLGYYEATHSAS